MFRHVTSFTVAVVLSGSLSSHAHQASSAPQSTIARDLSGFRSILIEAPTYNDGQVDPMRLKPYLEGLLAAQDWVVLTAVQRDSALSDRKQASGTLSCGIGHSSDRYKLQATLTCHDVFGREVFSYSASGGGMTFKGDLESALRKIGQRIRESRPAFDASKTVDLLETLPRVESTNISEGEIDRRIAAGELQESVEGVWGDPDSYRLGIVRGVRDGEFTVIVLEDLRTAVPDALRTWLPGLVKARLTRTGDGRTYLVRWADGYRRPATGLATVDKGLLTVSVTLVTGAKETVAFYKLRPGIDSTGRSGTTVPAVRTGTGFFCAPGVVATNYHVIDGSSSIEIYLPAQKIAFQLETMVADSVNDLVLLRVKGTSGQLPPFLTLTDASEARLGSEVFGVGFPLGDDLGSDHKVTSGIVSSVEGLGSDPRMFQITAPMQPGSSGSPIFDTAGRVIGIATASLDSIVGLKRSGQVPQNVNFAMKADYLALLLRQVPKSQGPIGVANSKAPQSRTELVEQVRLSVGQIRARR